MEKNWLIDANRLVKILKLLKQHQRPQPNFKIIGYEKSQNLAVGPLQLCKL
jgi:hypothetical protein